MNSSVSPIQGKPMVPDGSCLVSCFFATQTRRAITIKLRAAAAAAVIHIITRLSILISDFLIFTVIYCFVYIPKNLRQRCPQVQNCTINRETRGQEGIETGMGTWGNQCNKKKSKYKFYGKIESIPPTSLLISHLYHD